MLSAADLNTSTAFLSASSLPPIASWALKAWTETMAGGLVTNVAERAEEDDDSSMAGTGGDNNNEVSNSFACDISPNATLYTVRLSFSSSQ